jgi:hypothetical protein
MKSRHRSFEVTCTIIFSIAASIAAAQVNVTTHHGDNGRSGANLAESVLTPANVNAGQFGKLYTVPLDGQVYAQPLYVSGLAIPGQGSRNMVFVATMNNSVYALDADNNGQELWKANFGTPVHPCDVEWHQNITQGSSVGILGTPVIDLTTKTIYFVSRNESNFDPAKCNWVAPGHWTGVNQGIFTDYLNALDIVTGAPKFGSPMLITATYHSADNTLTFNPNVENQRAALTLANGHIYVAFASHDDVGFYHGWILAFNAQTLVQDHSYSDTTRSSSSKGGIWQAGSGLTVDSAGNIYASTGNGDFGPSANGVIQTGNSFIKLSPTLALLDYFTPTNSAALNSADQDLGSSGVMAIPGTSLIFGGGKQGRAYLVDGANMGKFNASTDNVKQEFQAIFGNGTQHIHGTPIYFNSQSLGPLIYVWGENDFLRAYTFNKTTQLLNSTPVAMSTMTAPETNNKGAMPGGFLTVSASGKTNGIIWASTPYNADSSQATVEGVLHAFDANTLRELWNDKVNESRDAVGNFAKFVPPIVANGKMFIPNFGALKSPDASGSLNVYGLIAGGSAQPPLVPDGIYEIISRYTGMAVDDPDSAKTAGTIQQQWTVNNGANQKWKLTNLGLNVVTLVSDASNLALDVANESKANSAFIDQSVFSDARSQLWTISSVGGGFFKLINVNSGQALDIYQGSTARGARLDQYPYKNVAWQQWSFR